jgi:hypothetical protein
MSAEATLGDGVLVLDDTGFAMPGKASGGVARQYSGTLVKVDNGQIAVTCRDTDSQVTWRGLRIDHLFPALPRRQRQAIRWQQGTKEWLRKKFIAVRCWRVTSASQRHVSWLLGERMTHGLPT